MYFIEKISDICHSIKTLFKYQSEKLDFKLKVHNVINYNRIIVLRYNSYTGSNNETTIYYCF